MKHARHIAAQRYEHTIAVVFFCSCVMSYAIYSTFLVYIRHRFPFFSLILTPKTFSCARLPLSTGLESGSSFFSLASRLALRSRHRSRQDMAFRRSSSSRCSAVTGAHTALILAAIASSFAAFVCDVLVSQNGGGRFLM